MPSADPKVATWAASQNDVTIERSVVGGRSSPLTSVCPEYRRLSHRRCREGQVLDQVDKRIEALESLNPATPHQLAAHLVVGDFWQNYPGAARNEPLKPARACQALGRPLRVRHQAQRSSVERDDRIHHVAPFCSAGKSGRSDRRSSSSA